MTRFRRCLPAVVCAGLGLAGGFVSHSQMTGQQAAPNQPPPIARDAWSLSPVVKRVLPAVVSIEAKSRAAGKAEDPAAEDPGFGSGVLIDPTGVVVTNYHVVQDATEVEITLTDGRKLTSRDIRRDPQSDLAVILLGSKQPLPFLEFADSDAMEVGDRVLAVGSPFGLTGSVTSGIVSAKSRQNLKLNQYEDFIQTDAAVNPGSSGGPLVNLEGRVIGITSAIKTRNGGFSGVGLAVASNLCKTVVAQLVRDGVVRRGYLGVSVRDLDPDLAKQLGVKPNAGAVITKLDEKGPGARAGLVVGDVITSVAGTPVQGSRDVQKIAAGLPLGQPADVVILRDGKLMLAKVTVERQPDPPAAPPPPQPQEGVVPFPKLGLGVADATPDLCGRLGYPAGTKGAVVMVVTRNGAADTAGLRSGQIIVKVDKTAVTNAGGFQQAIAQADKDKGALLHVLRTNGEVDFAVLKLP